MTFYSYMIIVAATTGAATMLDYPIQPVPFTQVEFQDQFWRPRLDTNRCVTLPSNFKKSEETGRISNFAKAGKLMEGKHEGIYFNDSDVFKVVEGASYTLALRQDPELDAYLDHLIGLFAAAQEEDGYLYTARTIDPANPAPGSGKERWENMAHAHELYNVGHMYEAAVAHYLATGKRSFLDIAIKNADLVDRVFGPGKKYAICGHPEIELALVKLFRVTSERRYLDLARFFIDQHGRGANRELLGEYCQDHMPLEEQSEPVGHAVRAGYFYAGAADVAILTGHYSYIEALQRIWENTVNSKMYITGGIGARHSGEMFGEKYELPNDTAYAETCAAIAYLLWNHRMFLLSGESKYMDIFERTLYNGFLVGVSRSGDLFFYVNPLAADGKRKFNHGAAGRQPWFDCSCCPTNVVRLLPSLPGYVYAVSDNTLYINLFVSGKAQLPMGQGTMVLRQETSYPWDGTVRILIEETVDTPVELRLRIPGWAQHQPVPGTLYRYVKTDHSSSEITLNGVAITPPVEKGYAIIKRSWSKGEIIEISFQMPVNRVVCNDKQVSNRDRIAFERGPLVYCAEGADNDGMVLNRWVPDEVDFTPTWIPDLLQGITVLDGSSLVYGTDPKNKQKTTTLTKPMRLIPYYAWAHRGEGEMAVWLPRTDHLVTVPDIRSSGKTPN